MYEAEDIEALLREHPRFIHGLTVKGPRLALREAQPTDAAFILSLRLDPALNQHLSEVPDDLQKQITYIEAAAADPKQLYFIIEADRPVGTVRLYDQQGGSFGWGSWILKDAPRGAAVESAELVYSLGIELGFTFAHFEVRKANEKVWRFHERYGAVRTGEDDLNYYYSVSRSSMPHRKKQEPC